MIGSRRPLRDRWFRVVAVEQLVLALDHEVGAALLLGRSSDSEFGIDGGTAQIGRNLSTLLLEPARPALGLALL